MVNSFLLSNATATLSCHNRGVRNSYIFCYVYNFIHEITCYIACYARKITNNWWRYPKGYSMVVIFLLFVPSEIRGVMEFSDGEHTYETATQSLGRVDNTVRCLERN